MGHDFDRAIEHGEAVLLKYDALKEYLASLGSVVVAFSGGVDSTFLLKTAKEMLGDGAIAVTARSCLFPERELEEAKDFCSVHSIRHIMCDFEELQIEGFRNNPVNRCYLCKRELFGKILAIAAENGVEHVAEGSNMDDMGDYRPGMQAIEELGIKSPLRHARLYKSEIRELSWQLGLKTAGKPSFACLASRFPYGEEISEKKLAMVDKSEQFLLNKGFRQVRVRVYGDVARIEIGEADFPKAMQQDNRKAIVAAFKECGFAYVALDLQGYRTGSMNETL